MSEPGKRAGRLLTVLWSLGLGIVVIACGISVLLPSTKRSRIKFEDLERMRRQSEANDEAAATQGAPATSSRTTTTTTTATTRSQGDGGEGGR